jgi:hypothetical protein
MRPGTGGVRASFILEENASAPERVRTMSDQRIIETPDESRQAVKGHGVRYVLAFGLSGAVIAMIVVGILILG